MSRGPGFALGLDLHGTLLEPGEKIEPALVPEVQNLLRRLRGRALRFICTGNDLDFVKRKVPPEILSEIDGCVLETGCSFSPDLDQEVVITSARERKTIKELESLLREQDFPELNYFAHRLTTISMFCDDPQAFWRKVSRFVEDAGYADKVTVTYSSVAVDIIPRGYDKFRGLSRRAEGRKTIGVADSMNDKALLLESDYAFSPANISPALLPLFEEKRRPVERVSEAKELLPGRVYLAEGRETAGVVEILSFLDRHLPGAGKV